MSACTRTCHFDECNRGRIGTLSSLSLAKSTTCGISSVLTQSDAPQNWFVGDNSGSVDIGRKPLRVKAHTDENGGSNVWMLMLGKPCIEWIDLINTQNNLYWFVIIIFAITSMHSLLRSAIHLSLRHLYLLFVGDNERLELMHSPTCLYICGFYIIMLLFTLSLFHL